MMLTTVPLPTFVQLEPVGQCNLRCQMCPIQFRTDGPPYGPPAFMPFETFTSRRIQTTETTIFVRSSGTGAPLLLLHGVPETHR